MIRFSEYPPSGLSSNLAQILATGLFTLYYSKTSFLVQIKFITEDSEQTQTQTLIIN